MISLSGIKMPVTHTTGDVRAKASKILKVSETKFQSFGIKKKSLDARDKNNIRYIYSVLISLPGEERFIGLPNVSGECKESAGYGGDIFTQNFFSAGRHRVKASPVVAGSGPAGLFCALMLARAGMKPVVLERGPDADTRTRHVELFFKTGAFNEDSNVLFGEGGAGTFSDGKLTCGVNDKRAGFVLKTLAEYGAPPEILYESKPHIGTDLLTGVVKNIRGAIESLGGEVRFLNKLSGFETDGTGTRRRITGAKASAKSGEYFIETDALVLAVGHSAYDTIEQLLQSGVIMAAKSFSAGFRIEHRREFINRLQYGESASLLPAADYKSAVKLSNGRGAYTFCMCPGGFVIPAVSEHGRLAVNGMSRRARDAENSNSAVLISVTPGDFDETSPLAGFKFRQGLEETAFTAGGGGFFAPAQTLRDFFLKAKTVSFGKVSPSYLPGVRPVNFYEYFDEEFLDGMAEAIRGMDMKMRGFADGDAVLTGIETRSSSPVTVPRGEDLCANIKGLYPCGEGLGHAGGIVSAAIDGIKCAEAVLSS